MIGENLQMASIVWGVLLIAFFLMLLTGKIVFGDKKKQSKKGI